MQISNSFSVSSVDALRNTSRGASSANTAESEASNGSLTPVDQLDLSSEAQGLSASDSSSSDIRVDRVADIRRQIADGTYDTDEKLSSALDNFLNQLG